MTSVCSRLSGPCPHAARCSLHADVVALAGLLALAAVLVAVGWGTWGDLGRDTGYDFSAAERVAAGEIPYADFDYYYGPLAPGLLGAFAWLFGSVTSPALAFGLIAQHRDRDLDVRARAHSDGPLGGFLAASITTSVALAPTNLSFVVPHSVLRTAGDSAHALAPSGSRESRARSRSAFALCSGRRPRLPDAHAARVPPRSGAATAAWLAVRAWTRQARWTDVLLVAGPAAAVPAIVYGAFLTVVGARELVFENLYPADELEAAGNTLLRLRAPLTPSSFAELAGRTAMYAAGAALLVVVALALGRRLGVRLLPVALAGGTAAAAAVAILRPETLRYWLQFAYGWIPLGAAVFVVYLLWRNRGRATGGRRDQQIALAVTVVLAVLAAKVYAAFFIHSARATARRLRRAVRRRLPCAAAPGRAVPMAERGGARRGWVAFWPPPAFGLTVNDGGRESVSVRGSGGRCPEPRRGNGVLRSC